MEKESWKKLVQKLIQNNATISIMESCTGGAIANEITNISGASSILKESYITYCNEAKIKLGVSSKVLEKYTVYSMKVAIEMAKNVKRVASSSIGVGITGLLGRLDPNNTSKQSNHVWYAIITSSNQIITEELDVPMKSRKVQKKYVTDAILKTLFSVYK